MRIGVDAGGTFTDFVVAVPHRPVEVFKLRSNPDDPAAVILEGVRRAARFASEPVDVVHGSTVATNALLERKGARTAFIASAGFRDLLALGRQNRRELYALLPSERVNLVTRELCAEWNGDPEALRSFVSTAGAEAVAICFLGAYADAQQEIAAEQALSDTGLYICRSSTIAPEFREYERASTTVLNAYVGPLMNRYLGRLEKECPHPIQIMQSSGGLLTTAEARAEAVRTILSGPAGGIVGARAMAQRAGYKQALTFDMGGTSTDVSLVEDPLRFATEAWVEGLPVRVPMLDIHTVGAGGGSIASVNSGGRLRVGPESAGSRPGPACYGAGERATVTDAHVVLGRISPKWFLDGSMPLHPDRAELAVAQIGKQLGIGIQEAARAILRIANSNMERAIRAVSVEKGRDPRDFPLVAFGGCGGLHACEIAEELGIQSVIFPPYAGALSALGMLLAPRARDWTAGALGHSDPGILLRDLRDRARADQPDASIEEHADIRYRGQSYELTVPWKEANPRESFETEYARNYGFHDPQRAIEIVAVRVRASEPANIDWLEQGLRLRSISDREEIEGGTLLFEYGATVFVPQGWQIEAHPAGSWIARRSEDLDTLTCRA